MASLTLKDVYKSFNQTDVITGIDLDIEHGEFVVFVGPSGCGKSTLLRMIAGLETITSGELWIGDELCNDVHPGDRGIAMVFQSYALYPHMSVYDNIGFNMKVTGVARDVRDAKIRNAARILQMEHLLERKPAQLSGGQRQRVAIGRAIVREPQVFLFDEPLSNLDAALRVDTRMELAKLHRDLGATMVYVTHDQVEAMTLADKIVVLNGGVVQQVGTPIELYQRPANRFVAGFIGSPKMNFIPVEVVGTGAGTVRVKFSDLSEIDVPAAPDKTRLGEQLTLGVRPQDLQLAEGGAIQCAVSVVERLGSETIVNGDVGSGGPILAVLDGDRPIEIGCSIRLSFESSKAILFNEEGLALLA
ncbi:multiple sugar transport system ATP-binding protein [Devosia crocina]|uniref:Multiple sugar transport system ATP-binding protein n=1 Tax=Devosia crocina TaxID=429728 RepID=A0A1I7MZP2_9HYPH|nr:sn-glycerol-3-phosphate ABC transporter ATP-binding protein UgpC [Devosia crocina]SFV27796.1 multiple sugar transport system ATP-binding protein [Devosia crocina]